MTGAVPEHPAPPRVRWLLDRAATLLAARDRLTIARDGLAAAGSPAAGTEPVPALAAALDAEARLLDEQLAGLYRIVELAEDAWDDLDGQQPIPADRGGHDARLSRALDHVLGDLRRLAGVGVTGGPGLDTAAEVASWADAEPEQVYARLEHLSPADRRVLALAEPGRVGNTYGVPWRVRAFANAVAVRRALHREQLAGTPWGIRIGRFETMLRRVPDPYAASGTDAARTPRVRRAFVAFSPERWGRMIELVGRVDATTEAVAVYVPGTGTNLDMSHVNTEVAEQLVAAAGRPLALLAFLDGEFPQDLMTESGQMVWAERMAPRLVRFLREVDRVVAVECPGAVVGVLAHSYGGRVLGTAERLGLRADRVVYAESPDRGVGVRSASDWRNPAPVLRFSFTAPGDPIEVVQQRFGLRAAGSHGDLGGTVRLDTGYFADGTPIWGPRGHGGVFDPGSDTVRAMLTVLVGGPVTPWRDRWIRARHTGARPGTDGRLIPALVRLALGQVLFRSREPYADARVLWEAPARTIEVPRSPRHRP